MKKENNKKSPSNSLPGDCKEVSCVLMLLDNIQFLANLDKGGDGAVELLAGVGCGELDADTSLSLRYNRVVEAGYIDVFLLQFGSELL